MSYVILFLVSSHCISWSLLHKVSGLLKIISLKIGRLNEFVEDVKRREELTEIIELHEVAYRSARALEKSLNVFMLMLYGMCILNLCVTMVSLSLVSIIDEVFFLGSCLTFNRSQTTTVIYCLKCW